MSAGAGDDGNRTAAIIYHLPFTIAQTIDAYLLRAAESRTPADWSGRF